MKNRKRLGSVKDWRPSGRSADGYDRPSFAAVSRPSSGNHTTKVIVAVAIVGVVALAVLNETGVLDLF